MVLYQVVYEDNEMWFTAGFAFAQDGFQAIEYVKTKCSERISKRTGRNNEEVKDKINFDFEQVVTVEGEIIQKHKIS